MRVSDGAVRVNLICHFGIAHGRTEPRAAHQIVLFQFSPQSKDTTKWMQLLLVSCGIKGKKVHLRTKYKKEIGKRP